MKEVTAYKVNGKVYATKSEAKVAEIQALFASYELPRSYYPLTAHALASIVSEDLPRFIDQLRRLM